MRRVGLLGGTFDPPHVGHLAAADEARTLLGLDEVRLMVAGQPWMKGEVTDAEHRVAMTELAVADDPYLSVDARETLRLRPTYTWETLEQLRREEPDVAWTFLLGADAARQLDQWNRVEHALDLAEFVVVSRSGSEAPPLRVKGRALRALEIPPMGVSSTEIRRRVAGHISMTYLVPLSVRRYMADHDLYGHQDDAR